ncbi:MAG: hypothetical protein A3I38_03550 [Candidatus Wildermuthbacteria bacterium RIFCSPLOWO2_02_FULL_47_10]|nr:MAG: hypothetical protein A3I38_03550 [Candidatus Wildermuthbacteria bacterium RIFCSPLOWO2_02_FULL_47_10]
MENPTPKAKTKIDVKIAVIKNLIAFEITLERTDGAIIHAGFLQFDVLPDNVGNAQAVFDFVNGRIKHGSYFQSYNHDIIKTPVFQLEKIWFLF